MPIAISEGARIFYRLEGAADKPLLVLVHSLGVDHGLWDPQMPALLRYFQVLRLDLRGHGASSRVSRGYRIVDYAVDVSAFLKQVIPSGAAIFGHSLGGGTGMCVAANPDCRVTALIVGDSVISPENFVRSLYDPLFLQMYKLMTRGLSQKEIAIGIGKIEIRIPGFSEINLYDALAFTIDRMKDIQGRKAILVMCTGVDTFSKLNYGEMLKIAKASDTAIYPVSILEYVDVRYGGGITAVEARNQLNYIAQYSGGQAYFPRFDGELPGIYEQVAGQLRMQYGLGFIPTNPSKDGRFHKLKVELVDEMGNQLRIPDRKGKPVKYKVFSREGYYAPKS